MSQTEHARVLDPNRTITIVSGMPRSGTSMMMQMLEAAGLEVATDSRRIADSDNPNGYYELDAVKRLREDSSFLKSVVGRVVKVVAPLMPFLPPEYDYRVISMERDLDEVLASQRVMLDRRGNSEVRQSEDEALARAYRRQLEKVNLWLAGQANIRACFVSHRLALRSPMEVSVTVLTFLVETGAFGTTANGSEARELVQTRMAAVVDPDLHRQCRVPGGTPELAVYASRSWAPK
jgi:hypothetical protein